MSLRSMISGLMDRDRGEKQTPPPEGGDENGAGAPPTPRSGRVGSQPLAYPPSGDAPAPGMATRLHPPPGGETIK